MSVGAAASLPRAIAAQPADDARAQPQELPPTITDAQGRVYRLQQDPVTGHPQYRHAAEQRDQAGNSLVLDILIDLAPDGSYTRRTSQQLTLANGDSQRELVLSSHAADGTQVGEQVETYRRQGNAITSEKTIGMFAAGELVRRETHLEQSDEATNSTTGEFTRVSAKIHGVWDNGGQPITDQTIPTVERTENQTIRSPGQGINKDTDRTIEFTRHAAGPLNALDWDEAGTLLVRFEGRKGQYIERELRVPLDQATGEPDMAKAEVTRTDDRQNLVNKGLMQARIWGGLASNLSWIIGINFARGRLGTGLLAFSAAASGAQLVGEGHAIATKRNDGDWGRLIMSAYDVLLTGMLAGYMSGRKDARSQLTSGQRAGLTAIGGAGLAVNGAELSGTLNPLGTTALTQRLRDAGIGAALAQPKVASPLDGNWRPEPRFDAASVLLGRS